MIGDRHETIRIVEVFPAPFGPRNPNASPRSISKLTLSTACLLYTSSMEFDGRAKGDLELIGQRNGSDGYQWRVAIVISSVTPTFSPALAGSDQTSTALVVMTLYQVGDAS